MPISTSTNPLATIASGASDALSYIGDQAGRIRYGVPTSEKEDMAEKGTIPGAAPASQANDEQDNRYASGYLFSHAHPTIGPLVQPLIDQVKTSDLPFFGGDSPEVQAYARQGMNRAVAENEVPQRQYPVPQASIQSAALRY